MKSKSVSVDIITATKRTGWEDLAQRSLRNQTVKYNQWIVVSEIPLPIMTIEAPKKIRKYNLNRSYNHAIKFSTADYILFYDDWIELEPHTLQYLLETATPKRLVTTATHENDKFDARYLGLDVPHPCLPDEWEMNVGLAPRQALLDVGGFDEEFDDRWAWGNVDFAERAAMLGYEVWIDERVQPRLIPHGRNTERENNGEFSAQRLRDIRAGKRPLKCNYL